MTITETVACRPPRRSILAPASMGCDHAMSTHGGYAHAKETT